MKRIDRPNPHGFSALLPVLHKITEVNPVIFLKASTAAPLLQQPILFP